MPVVFQQPSPMAPDVSIGGGRAQVATADFGALAQMYDAANRNQLQASQATAEMGLKASEAGAQLSQRQGELAVHQQDAAAQRQERMQMLAVEGSQRQQDQQQRAGLQAWLQGQELSQQESMHLQRMQSAVGQVMSDPTLADDEKQSLVTQLKTGIDPLRERQEKMKAQMLKQAMEDHKNGAMVNGAGDQANRQQWASNFPANSHVLDDGSTVTWDAKGTPHFHKAEHVDYEKVYTEAEKHVSAEEKALKDKDGKPIEADPAKHRQKVEEVAAAMRDFGRQMREKDVLDRKGLEKRYDPTTGQTFTVPKNAPQAQKPGIPVPPPKPTDDEARKEADAKAERAAELLRQRQQEADKQTPPRKWWEVMPQG